MALAAVKHFDPVVGVDVHAVIVAPAPAPVYLPHPYVGFVLDLREYVDAALGVIGSESVEVAMPCDDSAPVVSVRRQPVSVLTESLESMPVARTEDEHWFVSRDRFAARAVHDGRAVDGVLRILRHR